MRVCGLVEVAARRLETDARVMVDWGRVWPTEADPRAIDTTPVFWTVAHSYSDSRV